MFARHISLMALTLAIPAMPASAVEPLSDWKIEPSDARCVAVRQYGTSDKPIKLALKAPPTGKAMQLAVIRHAFRKNSAQTGATVTIDGQPFQTYALGYPLGYPAKASKQSVYLIHLPPAAAIAVRDASNLSVSVKGGLVDQFPLHNLKDAWAKMDTCLERLRATWNVGEDGTARIATPASEIVPLAGVFSSMDYPMQAVRLGFSGRTSVLLLIDEAGIVKDCTLTESSGMAVINSRTCALITYKARFKPAIGKAGKPTRSSWEQSINWRLED